MTGTEIESVQPLKASARLLLRYADLSPNEIARNTGFTPVEAAQALTELLADRDWLTMRQREQVLIHRMEEVIRDAEDRLSSADNDQYAPILSAVVRAMTEVGKRFDAQRKAIKIDLSEITHAQARVYGGSFDYAWDVGIDYLREMYDITDEEVREAKKRGMIAAQKKLQESVPND